MENDRMGTELSTVIRGADKARLFNLNSDFWWATIALKYESEVSIIKIQTDTKHSVKFWK
jgi:hypothetical protein